ncbi:MAG TPA: hypothetical protein VH396_04495 [Chitinophagaceae bacterium]
MKKLFFPLLTLVCMGTIISCKKELVQNEVPGASSETVSSDDKSTAASNTHFGALVDARSSDDRITVIKKLGAEYARVAVFLKEFKGKSGMMDKCAKNGIKVLLNLNYAQVRNKKPNPFPKDMVTYKKLLQSVLSKYKPEVAVIENEPTTGIFHSGPIEDYITMLAVAVDVCHANGVKVADGAIHVGYVQDIMNGGRLSGKTLDVQKLITAYKTLDLDYVNIHTAGDGNSYPSGVLEKVADYVRGATGKPVMSNEFSVHSSSTSLIKSMINGFKAGNYVYAIVRSGNSSSGAEPLHKGTNLLPNGVAFRDDIQ